MKTKTSNNKVNLLFFLAIVCFFICIISVMTNVNFAFASNSDLADEDYEVIAENDRISKTTSDDGISKPRPEADGSTIFEDHDTYYVIGGFNKIKKTIDNQYFSFDYNLRGFFGDYPGKGERRANVQYFYNTKSRIMVILTFGNGEHGFKTYNYNTTLNTVFEDEIDYKDEKNHTVFTYDIAENLQICYIDPDIERIGGYNFQCCEKLWIVDFIYQTAKYSKLKNDINNIGDCAFRKTNRSHGCDVRILLAYDYINIQKLLSEDERARWACHCPVVFNGQRFEPVS